MATASKICVCIYSTHSIILKLLHTVFISVRGVLRWIWMRVGWVTVNVPLLLSKADQTSEKGKLLVSAE